MKAKNANFDFVGATNRAYKTAWENRSPLLRLAVTPFLIKCGCLAAILFLGFEGQILRHGLVMLPAYFAEGFLIAYIIRTLHSGGDLSGDVRQAQNYYNDVIAAMIVFVLIQLTLAFVVGNTVSAIPEDPSQIEQPVPSAETFMIAMLTIAFMIWAFRFAWFHIPIAMGMSLKSFMERIAPFSSSLPILGAWLLCFLPLAFIMSLLARVVLLFLPQVEGSDNTLSNLILFCMQGGFEMVINVIAAIAMSYGFKSLMDKK